MLALWKEGKMSHEAAAKCPNPRCQDGWVAWEPNESRGDPPIPCRHSDCPHRPSHEAAAERAREQALEWANGVTNPDGFGFWLAEGVRSYAAALSTAQERKRAISKAARDYLRMSSCRSVHCFEARERLATALSADTETP